MRFSQYQQAEIGFQPEGKDVFLSETEQPCMNCGEPTPWVDFCLEAHLCSEECSETVWQEFIWASRASDAQKLVDPGEYVQLGLLPSMAKPAVQCPTYNAAKNA